MADNATTSPKIYFQNEEIFEKVKTFLELFEIELLLHKGNVIFQEKGTSVPIVESALFERPDQQDKG